MPVSHGEHVPISADNSGCDAPAGHCHLCGDEAVVGRVVDIDARARTATVEFSGSIATVALDLVDASVGDDVLVHLGFAIGRMSTT